MTNKTRVNVNDGYQPTSKPKGYQPINEGYHPSSNSNEVPAERGYQPSVASSEKPTPPGDE